MGGVLGLIANGLKWLIALVGLALWLGGVALLSVAIWVNVDDKAQAALSIGGVLIALVLSVLLLRATTRISAFLLCMAFGAIAAVGPVAELGSHEMNAKAVAPAAPAPAAPAPADDEAEEAAAGSSPSTGDLEQEAARAEEAYLQASQRLARARAQQSGAASAKDATKAAEPPVLAAPAPPPPPAVSRPRPAPEADQFKLAELRFNKPDEMQLGQSYVVEATIAAPGAAAPRGLGDVGPTVTRQTEITRKVRVELVASDFKIEKLHTIDTVLITDKTPGQWSWRVTPTVEGLDRKMLLQVFGVLEQAGAEQGQVLIKTYEEKIQVKVTPAARAKMWLQGLIDSWQMIAGLAGVIGGVWVFAGNVLRALRPKASAPA